MHGEEFRQHVLSAAVGEVTDPGITRQCLFHRPVFPEPTQEQGGVPERGSCTIEETGPYHPCRRAAPCQPRGCCQAIQSQRRRNARLNHCRSWMPSPPCDDGEQIACQLTLQLAPEISSSCFHKNRRLHLSTSLKHFFCTRRTVSANVGIALSTHRTSTHRPAMGISRPFHPVSLALIL